MSLDLAFDFGSAFTRIARGTGELLVEEPTVAAVDEDTGRVLAFGAEALGLGASCAGRVGVYHPVRHGQLADLALAEQVLDAVLDRAGSSRLNRARVAVAMHVDATEVQRRALERGLRRAGARQVRFVEQPIACAIGRDLDISEPLGQMVVDVGGGTTDIGVMALGGIVSAGAVPLGCDDLDDAIRMLLARRDGLVVDHRTAAEIRQHFAVILAPGSTESLEVTGRDQRTGEARATVVGRVALAEALDALIAPIVGAAIAAITGAPPDLANDLLGTGIVLAGGGANLYGLRARLADATGVPIVVAPEYGRLAVLGAARMLSEFETLAPTLSLSARR
jgi:rod shape-determining protein MreB and related proteins